MEAGVGARVVQIEFAFIHKVTKHANSIYLLRTVMVTLRPSDHHGNSDLTSICSRGSSVLYRFAPPGFPGWRFVLVDL